MAALWQLSGWFREDVTPSGTALTTTIIPLALGAVVGAAIGWWRSTGRRARIAYHLERRAPEANNLLITAHELLTVSHAATSRTNDAVSALVLQRADHLAATLDVPSLLPAKRSVLLLCSGLAVWAVSVAVSRPLTANQSIPSPSALVASVTGRVDIQRIVVRIAAPPYARRPPMTLRDPVRIEALIGSIVSFTIEASADTLIAVTRQGTQTLTPNAAGLFALSLPATLDGFVALEPRTNKGRAGPRRLIGLTVRTDEAPRVRIVAPARDLIVPDARRSLDVRLEADDDLAVGSLRLRYTKVSGSGERFTFSEGDVPIAISRVSATQWSARASLALGPLLLEPGDLVVYRAVASDRRPGSPPVESDAFIAELAAPGGVAALGFSLDPDEDRYALSQQMVILKTERLIARRAAMPATLLAEEAAQLAGEQRRVRAEFVFMMGGEFAQQATGEVGEDLDETLEAEGESDLSAGRMVNRGRTALLAAVRAMSRAAVSLNTADLTAALANEKRALTQLQDAFARSRFLMRALSQREQLDPARRLTGRLDSTARGSTPVPDGDRDARRVAWRAILHEVLALGRDAPRTEQDTAPHNPAQFIALAERVLQLDASTPAAQRIAAQLAAAGTAFSNSPTSLRARVLLDSAAMGLTALQRPLLRPAASAAVPIELRRLRADLEAALRNAAPRAGPP